MGNRLSNDPEQTPPSDDPDELPESQESSANATNINDVSDSSESGNARLATLAKQIDVPPDALVAFFNYMSMKKSQFVQFKERGNTHTLPIIDFVVLYKHKTTSVWVPRAPSPYTANEKGIDQGIQVNGQNVKVKTDEKVESSDLSKLKFRTAETALRAMIKLPAELRDYTPVFCAVLEDRATKVRFTIPEDGLRNADASRVAALFLRAYPEACRPPGWTLRQTTSDADQYIRVGDKTLREQSPKDPEAGRAQIVLEKKLADYAVGTSAWTQLAWRVYLVEPTESDLALTRLPCKGFVAKELQRFGYTRSGYEDAKTLLPPLGVYVRTPFVGRVPAAPSRAAVTAAQRVVDAAIAAKNADATKPGPSPDEIRALQGAQNSLVDALTPPVYKLDVVNITGPVIERKDKKTREYNAMFYINDREAWIRQRLEQCFDIIFFVAEHEHKHAIVMRFFGSGDFTGFDLPLTYEEYFTQVLQATMRLHPRIKVYFELTPQMPGTLPAKFPDIIDEHSDALFVNDMGPEYVVGNCHFSDPSPNGYFGSHSAMAYLTEPAINIHIGAKTIMSTPRDYTRPPPTAPPAPSVTFASPENAPSDYAVERGTLGELAMAGDKRVREGFVPCGSVLEHNNTLYQAFVRLHIDPMPLWTTFEKKQQRYKASKN